MTKADFQGYISGKIPITGPLGMGFVVTRFDDGGVAIRAPLSANVNDKGTAFGGSIASLLTMTAWGMAMCVVGRLPGTRQIVIQKCSIEYLSPLEGDFEATATAPEAAVAERFLRMLGQFGKARIPVSARISTAEGPAAIFEGSFVALPSAGDWLPREPLSRGGSGPRRAP